MSAEMVAMFDDAQDARTAIYQAVGAASVCWEDPGGAGIFDSKQALVVAEGLIARLTTLGLQIDGQEAPDGDRS